MADLIELPTTTNLYEVDEHAWIERQIAALREGAFDRLDRANLIEFLSSMAARDRRELASRMTLLMQHMIKYSVQPERASRSWTLPSWSSSGRFAAYLPRSQLCVPEPMRFCGKSFPTPKKRH